MNCRRDSNPQADSLRRRAVSTAAGAACMAGMPALMASGPLHQHLWVGFVVIGLQVCLLAKAVQLMAQRKRLLRTNLD